jgi:endoglycosylceramidase
VASRIAVALLGLSLLAASCSDNKSGSATATTSTTTASTATESFGLASMLAAPNATSTVTGTDGRIYMADAEGRAIVSQGWANKAHKKLTRADFKQLRERGWRLFRLGVYWADAEPEQGKWDDAYFDSVRATLDAAQAEGVMVVLDMHQDGYSRLTGGYGIPDWTTRTDGLPTPVAAPDLSNIEQVRLSAGHQRAWQHLYEDADLQAAQAENWRQWVKRLNGHPALFGYDLINEAFGQVNPGEELLSAGKRIEATQLTAMQQRLIDAIRQLDTTRWIFVEGMYALGSSLAAPGGLGALHDAAQRLVFAPHLYDVAMEAGQPWNPASTFLERYWPNMVDGARNNHTPILVMEWGARPVNDPNTADFVAKALAGMDAHTSGYAAWSWMPVDKPGDWAPIDRSGNPGGGMSAILAPYVQRIAGKPGARTSVPSKASVTLTDPSPDHDTVFFVPRSQFPAQPKLDHRGAGQPRVTFDADQQLLKVRLTEPGEHTLTVTPT